MNQPSMSGRNLQDENSLLLQRIRTLELASEEYSKADAVLRERERRWAFAIEGTGAGLVEWEIPSGRLQFSPRWLEMTGFSTNEAPSRLEELTALIHPDDLPFAIADIHEVLEGRKTIHTIEHRVKHKGGHWIWVQSRSMVSVWSETREPLRMIGTHVDITERKQAETALKESEEKLRTLFNTMSEGVALNQVVYDEQREMVDYRVLEVNESFYRLADYAPGQVVGKLATELYGMSTEVIRAFWRSHKDATEASQSEMISPRAKRTYLVSASPIVNDTFVTSFLDISERTRADQKRAALEAQLQQAQKLESVGQLAGGVAHDFNNMLSVIIGHAELALGLEEQNESLRSHIEEVLKAASRSVDLTRQLLTFARKQDVVPQVLDLNAAVLGTLRMLERLIGEDVVLRWVPGEGLWNVKVDPSQIDQILANLCVNSRDAITSGGVITISTNNVSVLETSGKRPPEIVPGDYVQLVVSDDGCGMPPETLTHIFEPFYTTKAAGRGTGLGLASVYGAVKQNGGFIDVESTLGVGSTFTLFLPRCEGSNLSANARTKTAASTWGHETILLVEDEPSILQLARVFLERQGYRVLIAATPAEAIRRATEYAGAIHLLITDVVMPEMNGRALARELLALKPDLKSLFISGYTSDVIARHGVVNEGINFLQKPFTREVLITKVREVLDRESKSAYNRLTGEPPHER